MPEAIFELPYEGTKEMLFVESVNSKAFVFEAPIDMLAYITMHKQGWENHSYADAVGVREIFPRQKGRGRNTSRKLFG